mmetsp:Transcript_54312/g.118146  ORF Transcript_54312/g.118146 Transcript_54312/m.118146 type:complete len:220 (+) Transcript_54312:402-1061(+)
MLGEQLFRLLGQRIECFVYGIDTETCETVLGVGRGVGLVDRLGRDGDTLRQCLVPEHILHSHKIEDEGHDVGCLLVVCLSNEIDHSLSPHLPEKAGGVHSPNTPTHLPLHHLRHASARPSLQWRWGLHLHSLRRLGLTPFPSTSRLAATTASARRSCLRLNWFRWFCFLVRDALDEIVSGQTLERFRDKLPIWCDPSFSVCSQCGLHEKLIKWQSAMLE